MPTHSEYEIDSVLDTLGHNSGQMGFARTTFMLKAISAKFRPIYKGL